MQGVRRRKMPARGDRRIRRRPGGRSAALGAASRVLARGRVAGAGRRAAPRPSGNCRSWPRLPPVADDRANAAAATPRLPHGYSADESRRGCPVDIPRTSRTFLGALRDATPAVLALLRAAARTDLPRTGRGTAAAAPWIFRGRREPSWGRFATTTPAVLVFVPCRGDAAAATRIVLGRHERRRRRSEAPRIIENGLRRYWLNLDGVRPAHNPPLFLHIAKTAGSMVRGCLPHHCDGDAESRLRGCLPAGRERARPDGLCQSRFLRGKPDRSVGPVPSFATQVALARADPRVFGRMAQSDAGGLADVLRRPPSALSPRGESADWVAAPPRRAARTFPRGRASRPRRGYFLWR